MKKTDIYSFLFAEVALIVDWLYTGEEESLCLTDSNVVDIQTTAHYLGLVHFTMSITTFTTHRSSAVSRVQYWECLGLFTYTSIWYKTFIQWSVYFKGLVRGEKDSSKIIYLY